MQAIAGAEHGGAENFFVRLVLALRRAGVEQRVVMRTNRRRAEVLREGGVEAVELRFGGPLDVATRVRLRRLAAAWRPDVVVTWMRRASRLFPAGPYVRIGRLGGYYDLRSFRRCDHLIAITPDIVDYVANGGWPRDRAHYVPNFVDFAPAEPLPRAALGTPEGVPLVLALGRLHVNKAFDVLLQALARVPEAHLWLAGEGPERAALQRLASELGLGPRVRFLGWRGDLAALYGAADICAFPSRYEPFGTVTLEAWAAGVPLVAAAASGPAGLVRSEEDALLVPVDDAEALARALGRLIDDAALRERLVAGGRARWQAEFTESAAVRRWQELLARVTA